MPFAIRGRSPVEVETAILGDDPSALAAKASGGAVEAGRAEWQDLDVLCLTALQKDARRRYPSAEALLRDVDHFLQGRPPDARPESARYRLAKFIRRHRWPVGKAALATLALGGTGRWPLAARAATSWAPPRGQSGGIP